jgi:hypothetical protein
MMKLKKYVAVAVSAVLSLSTISAFAANPTALLTISQADGTVWQENMTGLLVVDAQNNFSLLQGGGTGLFQNGSFVSAIDTAAHPDYWQWKVDATTNLGSWNWHSAQTNSGASPSVATAIDPWMSSLTLSNAGGHGDPDLSYAFSAVNNNAITQTYTFAIGEAILPPVGSTNNVYADIAGGLTSKGAGAATISPFGTNSAIQQFELSSDNGLSFVNAGVDIGPAASAIGTSTYGPFASNTIAGPVGQTWNYMQLTSKFTLSANSRASLVGFASITPVPEPDTSAMLLAGLGFIGFMSRRRKHSI